MNISDAFLKSIEDDERFKEALEIVELNSRGDIWLIGGSVYRSIVKILYGGTSTPKDLDFIIEVPLDLKLPPGWVTKKNSFGNPKFLGESYDIDFVPLKNVHPIVRRGLEPKIENYLSGTPLTIQSIAYDVRRHKLIGDVGIKAIREKIVAILDQEEARHYVQLKGVTLEGFVKEKADSLGFHAIIPS